MWTDDALAAELYDRLHARSAVVDDDTQDAMVRRMGPTRLRRLLRCLEGGEVPVTLSSGLVGGWRDVLAAEGLLPPPARERR